MKGYRKIKNKKRLEQEQQEEREKEQSVSLYKNIVLGRAWKEPLMLFVLNFRAFPTYLNLRT